MDDQDASARKPSIIFNGNGQSIRRPSNTENDYQQMIHIYERWSERYSQGNDERIYFSMRDHYGEGGTRFLNSLDTERREKVTHEKNRVAKLRNKFFDNETKRDLVKKHEAFRKAWRTEARDRQKGNLNKLEKQKKELDTLKPDEKERRRLALLNQERILKAISKWNWADSDALPTEPDPKVEKSNESDYGLKASVLYFEKVAGGGYCGHNPGKFPGQKFPDHKIRIEELLSVSPENPLKREKDPSNSNTFRCFHLPTNNMAWIEQAMSNYYNETIPDHQSRRPPNLRGHTERLLAREYWKGQMHGGTEHPVHARHMRPRFSRVSSSSARITSSVPSSPIIGPSLSRRPSGAGNRRESSLSIITETRPTTTENFSLFMPYLHWETNSRRSKMAEVVLELKKDKLKQKEKPKASRTGVPSEKKMETRERKSRTRKDGDNFHRVVRNIMPNRTKQLGPYLMSVAKIADAMDYEADERLLRDHLHADPPLHIRRTLDQSYFWTLEDTTNRDRDQVVYRGTRGQDVYNPRVVMVDQLWMWILDENTIITSFPRRWGRNKPDPSGVQKSLRERLTHLDDDSIKSVFDLALMIIDQCSRVFFDRTQPTDQRPEVMDIFSSTIAHITGMKTEAYEAFWYQMKADSLHVVRKGESLGTSENSVRAYLNVNPEGTLLRECQDVVEELRMMKRIFAQQYQVVKDFTKALTKLNESKDEPFLEATEPRTLRQQYTRVPKSTLTHAAELLDQIDERKGEIEDLEDAAKRTCEQLQELLALKQQQASIIEARMALIRADASIQQGRSIMLFTIVTILFLPLSFFTSIFGMNNQEWTQSGLSIHQQFRFMFPVSFAVILVSLLLAFSNWTRSLFKMAVRVSWVWAVEHSPLRWLWEVLPSSPQQFEEMEKSYLNKVKEERQKRVDKRRDKRAKATEEKKKLDEEKNNKKEGEKYDRNERRRTLTSSTSSPENENGSTQKRRKSIWEDIV